MIYQNTPSSSDDSPGRLSEFVSLLPSRGRYTFTREEAKAALRLSDSAVMSSLLRLQNALQIAQPRRGFFVVIPPEYAPSGAPPANWYIDDLMRFETLPYYVALFSAAAIHGAAHQQAQEFQVMTTNPLRPSECGRNRIHFFVKSQLKKTQTVTINTPTGTIRVATPETTALDLIRYGLVRYDLGLLATLISELAEKIDPKQLYEAAKIEKDLPSAQRLGYLLEATEHTDITELLYQLINKKKPRRIPLHPRLSLRNTKKNDRWRLSINTKIEIET